MTEGWNNRMNDLMNERMTEGWNNRINDLRND